MLLHGVEAVQKMIFEWELLWRWTVLNEMVSLFCENLVDCAVIGQSRHDLVSGFKKASD